jgi:hypothetical protein
MEIVAMAFWNRWFGPKQAPQPERPPPPRVVDILSGLPETEQGRALAQQIQWAEAAYDEMYEGRSPSGPYSEMKACLVEAIRIARELELIDKVAALERLLEHRQSVFRHQMR